MTTTEPPTPASSPSAVSPLPADRSTWNETQYLQALAHLTSLQTKISTLRDAIPSLIRPLAAFQPSHQQLRQRQQQQQQQYHTNSNSSTSTTSTTSNPALASRMPDQNQGQKQNQNQKQTQNQNHIKHNSNGADAAQRYDYQSLSDAENRRRKEKVVATIRAKAEEGAKGIKELREVWGHEGTVVVLKAGRERREGREETGTGVLGAANGEEKGVGEG